MKLNDVVSFGNLVLRAHALALRTYKAVKLPAGMTVKTDSSDDNLRKALRHLQFAQVEIDAAVKATEHLRHESIAQRTKAALTYLRAGNAKAGQA